VTLECGGPIRELDAHRNKPQPMELRLHRDSGTHSEARSAAKRSISKAFITYLQGIYQLKS